MQMQINKQHGFSLVELMIVVAIIAILARIAYPTYQDSLVKSRRADAKAALSELSVFMERWYTTNGCYTSGSCATSTTTAPTLPFLVAPKSGKVNYNLSVVTTPSTFTLTAAPIRATDDATCGSLTLTNTGTKGAIVGTTALTDAAAAACW
jgi:type IV pilus assembly protein PilE